MPFGLVALIFSGRPDLSGVTVCTVLPGYVVVVRTSFLSYAYVVVLPLGSFSSLSLLTLFQV